MKRWLAKLGWFLIAGIAGCIHAPDGKKDTTSVFRFESGRTPYAAAICIARNARSLRGITAQERLLGDTSWEVVVVQSGWSANSLAVAQADDNHNGSLVSVRVSAAPHGDPLRFAQQLMADCQARLVSP